MRRSSWTAAIVACVALVSARAASGGQRAMAPGAVKVHPKDGLKYVWIPPGKFSMGCSPGDSECQPDERPHEVTLTKGFWLGQTEVVQSAYEKFSTRNLSRHRGPNLPVETVTWDEANTYCQTIGGRLPTDAEWEYAARAGTTASRYGDLDRIAWHAGNADARTHDVATKEPNAWGLYDMIGNVVEWTADWYDEKYWDTAPATDPPGPSTGRFRSVRGGGRNPGPGSYRVSFRGRFNPMGLSFGFRCVGE
jgi:formylglycine-generating enzyme required for sulfatase activity